MSEWSMWTPIRWCRPCEVGWADTGEPCWSCGTRDDIVEQQPFKNRHRQEEPRRAA